MLSRKITLFCVVLALASQALSSQTTWSQEIRWAPDVPTARKASMEYKVPVLLHFYGDNCLPCKVLEQNVLSRSEVVDTLNKYFICVRVNASQDRETAAQYGVHSWPTDVFISPDGRTLDQGVCKQSANEYLGVLHGVAIMNRDRNILLAAEQTNQAQQVSSQVANYAQPASNGTDGANRGNAPATGLPPAGQVASGNPQGPNFYTQAAETQRQQLPHSLGPNASVTSGPMLSQDQPHAVTTAIQAAGTQIAPASQHHAMNTTPGQLPPMDATAQAGSALPSRNADPRAALMSTAPNVPAPPAVAAAPAANAWNQPRTTHMAAGESQMVDNPHFNPNPASTAAPSVAGLGAANMMNSAAAEPVAANSVAANSVAASGAATVATVPASSMPIAGSQTAATAATSSTRIPASTVSFQPRAALSPQANTLGSAASASVNAHANPATVAQGTGATGQPSSIALDGYCPVALKTQGTWIAGQPQFAVKHRGRIYHLSSQDAMREFLQNPDRCSPVMSGYDAMTFLNEGKLVEGSIQYGLHDLTSGSILLFTSAESKQAYEQNFDRNTQALKIVLQNAGVGQ